MRRYENRYAKTQNECVSLQKESLLSYFHINHAARVLAGGGVVAYPTEGVYGIGCLPFDRTAADRILAMKNRSWRKGLLLIAADVAQIEQLIILPQGRLGSEILSSWPGAVTWVLEARLPTPKWISGGRNTLAVRVTDHPVASMLCRRVASPLVSTSANRSDRPPLSRMVQVRRVLGSKLDYVVPGALGSSVSPTIIRDGQTGRVLRA